MDYLPKDPAVRGVRTEQGGGMAVAEGGVGGIDEWEIDGVDGVEDKPHP